MKSFIAVGGLSLVLSGCPTQGDRKQPTDVHVDASPLPMTAGTRGMTTGTSASIDSHPGAKPVKVTVDTKFTPAKIPAKKGQPLAIEFMRTTDKTCAKEVIFDGGPLAGKQVDLPLDKPVRVSFTPAADGDIIFGCNMGRMISGKVTVSS